MKKDGSYGFYFEGHPVSIQRLCYLLCSPKPKFTPEGLYMKPVLTKEQSCELEKFIKNGGANIFRNSIHRQHYIPVTRQDLVSFLFGPPAAYAERPEPWFPEDVSFEALVLLCLSKKNDYENWLTVLGRPPLCTHFSREDLGPIRGVPRQVLHIIFSWDKGNSQAPQGPTGFLSFLM